MGERTPVPVWLYVLIFVFTVWNPAGLAHHLASNVWTIASRSPVSLAFLGARFVVTSIGVAAGIALWLQRPAGVSLAKISLILFGIEAAIRLSGRIDLSAAPPGTRLPIAVFIVTHNAAWYWYLHRSRRVAAAYGLKSHF